MQKATFAARSRPGRSTRVDVVADRLRQGITGGELTAGSKLSEPSLALRHGVSRAPVREALRQLEREGLVVFDQVGRSRVAVMTPSDFQDISAIRVALESAAAAEAAVRFTESLRAILESNIESMRAARSLADVTRLDLEFHTSVMESSGRRPLITTWKSIQSQLALWLGSLHRTREAVAADVLTQTIEAHRSLIDVLASGDSARSAAAFSEHAAGLVRWVTDVGGRVP